MLTHNGVLSMCYKLNKKPTKKASPYLLKVVKLCKADEKGMVSRQVLFELRPKVMLKKKLEEFFVEWDDLGVKIKKRAS